MTLSSRSLPEIVTRSQPSLAETDGQSKNTRVFEKPRHRQLAARARAYGGRIGKRIGVMLTAAALLSVMLIPLHESANIGMYDYGTMKFDWTTDPSAWLKPADPAYSDYNVLLDGHAHTTLSDGRLTPEQLVEYAIAQGFNALVVTDHNTVAGGLQAERYARKKYAGRFVVIPGMEYSNCRVHMNLIDINATVAGSSNGGAYPSDDEIQRVIAHTHAQGGLAIINHIPWSTRILERLGHARLPGHPSVKALVDWGIDGFEVINQATFDMPTLQFMRAHNSSHLLFMTGSDVHAPGKAYAWTVLKVPVFTKEAIMNEIRAGRTSYLFDPTGNRAGELPTYSPRYLALAPLAGAAEYIASFYDRYSGQYSFHGTHCQRDIVDVHSRSIGYLVMYIITAAVLTELARVLCQQIRFCVVRWWIKRRSNSTVAEPAQPV
ncbi:hypothetical protein GGH19_004422 [Coemansia sp. RSA 1807]|nr:hypothetical protein GGF48_001032 [Coemansia sp. RSA 921]KAJ2138371.1 hypothetical protein GGH17_001152 [Coemansia sp. RSA 788]KAJ2279640.1 hypothetical protein EV176_001415 [Coemansia sp. RSA 451]KAJ2405227.1 hypothetical protein J3F80_004330 [Coemansia sp. RSA 2526]KAJ2533321.1 hypothetical protein GGH20_000714 [Coemansia sp. RSA 1937]KAJ2573667.1 hypothetical protein GGH19_004422 [Coemansia sp. RSA 1807]KAJ2727558.1 hypothetical protein H4S00_001506 [Coemansia sp. D1744]